jgi:transposase InsO family protein
VGALLRRSGWVVNRKKVLRLMREDNLLVLRKQRYVLTTDSRHAWQICENHVRGLQLTGVDQVWVADITFLRLREEFVYLAVVLDAYSRKVVGWALSRTIDTALTLEALRRALAERPAPKIHHSDRGVQYAALDYVELLGRYNILPSMSRVGNPYDNAKAESFMKTLKREQMDGRAYRNLAELEASLADFLERVYNRKRLHSALGYQSPEEFEQALRRGEAPYGASPPRPTATPCPPAGATCHQFPCLS